MKRTSSIKSTTALRKKLSDITKRKQPEEQLFRLNRLYSVLSKVSETIVRVHEPKTLFQEVCRIAVEDGLFKMAWIGLVEPATKKVTPVASYGDTGGYLNNLTIYAADVPEGRGPTGRAVYEVRPSICSDIENDPIMLPWRDKALQQGFRASAAFPIFERSRVTGAFTLYASTPQFFTDEEINLFLSLSENISFALDSFANEKKRLEAETELQKTSAEMQDLYNNAPCGYHSLDKDGIFVRINDTELDWLGYSREEVIGKMKFSDLLTSGSSETFAGEFPKFKEQGWINDLEYELVRRDGTILSVLLNATAIGDKNGNFLMSRSTTYDITERKETDRQIKATNELLKLFSHTFLRREYLDALAGLLRKWCDCGGVGIRLIDEQGIISYGAFAGFSQEFLEQENCLSVRKDQCVCTRIIVGKPVQREAQFITPNGSFFCNDMKCFISGVTKAGRAPYRGTCVDQGFSSIATIPIRYRKSVLGAVHIVDERAGRVPLKLIEFVESLTPLMGEAIYRFYIEESLMASREQLRDLSAHLLSAREEERTRIAREIHDELGQILTAASIELSGIKGKNTLDKSANDKLSAVSELIDSAVQDIQSICSELRPRVLDHLGLWMAIEWQAQKFSERSGIACILESPHEQIKLPDSISTALFRIFQEALTNITRHSGATEVTVSLETDDHTLVLRIRDNGKGASKQQLFGEQSFGILGIRERAHDLGGAVTFRGVRNKGTTITVKIPLRKGGENVHNPYSRRSSDRTQGA